MSKVLNKVFTFDSHLIFVIIILIEINVEKRVLQTLGHVSEADVIAAM